MAVPLTASADAGGAEARDRYAITARLVPERQLVEASATISWRNRSAVPLRQLWFHLYANAFANDGTLFMREQGQGLRGTRLQRRGGIDVLQLRSGSGEDLLAHSSSDVIPGDATQLRVDLPAPLAPGAALEMHVVFRVRLPSIVARMGAEGQFFMLGQWFPKLAKLEPDGRWVSFPYHGLGEFYADFADYDLRVEVPADFVVAAPGELLERTRSQAGARSERYRLRNALDIAWAASPTLRVVHARAGAVAIDVYAPAGHRALAREQAETLRAGLAQLGMKLGPYPYPRLVLVLPPSAALGASGMEYPGLISGWPVGWLTALNPLASGMQRMVTAHEFAHQWFAILLASNELQTPMLDEGLAEWTGIELATGHRDRDFFARTLGLPIDVFEISRAALPQATPSSLLPAYRYRPNQLGPAVYLRPSLALESVARTFGRARLWNALGRYARDHRFGHPTLDDFWRAFDGSYWPGFSAQLLRPLLEGVLPGTELRTPAKPAATPLGLCAARSGDATTPAFPESIEIAGTDGTRRLEAWPAAQPELSIPAQPALLGVSVDPGRHNLLDASRRNDQLRIAPAAPQSSLVVRVLLWAQALLMGFGP